MYILVWVFLVSLLGGCSKQYHRVSFDSKVQPALCISMPQNKHVLSNISSLFYTSFWNHFDRKGYELVLKEHDAYFLKSEILEFEGIEKLVSPDFLTYGSQLKLVMRVTLFNTQGYLIAEKNFIQTSLFLKPRHPMYNSAYTEFVTTRLAHTLAVRLEVWVRQMIIKAEKI